VISGLATFLDFSSGIVTKKKKSKAKEPEDTTPRVSKYHPYLSLRIRGVIHPLPDQPEKRPPPSKKPEAHSVSNNKDQSKGKGKGKAKAKAKAKAKGKGQAKEPAKPKAKAKAKGRPEFEYDIDAEPTFIPGWQRIVMIMYKPTKRSLIQVLEYAEENYGDAFGPIISSILTQNAQQTDEDGNPIPTTIDINDPLTWETPEVEAEFEKYLHEKLLSKPEWSTGEGLTRESIEAMETRFRAAFALDWLDMEYAYAYEGVIVPGGKIMMGRWWRCGLLGEGMAMELNPDGGPVDQPSDDEEDDGDGGDGTPMDVDAASSAAEANEVVEEANTERVAKKPDVSNGLERGPFVFWS